jgi:Anaerobic dehydrogenases, typically selenocysteine-containing
LISPKSPHRTHSQGSNIAEIRKKDAHCLTMHPDDAARRGIQTGERGHLFNEQGRAYIPVKLSEDIVPGVVCLPEGIWVGLNDAEIDTAGAANMFTATTGTAPGIACIMHAVGVEVEKVH